MDVGKGFSHPCHLWHEGGCGESKEGRRGVHGEVSVLTFSKTASSIGCRALEDHSTSTWFVCNLLVEVVVPCRHQVKNSLLFFFYLKKDRELSVVRRSGDHSHQDCIDGMLCHLEAKPKTRVSVPGGRARWQGAQGSDVVCQAGTSHPPWLDLCLLLLSHPCVAPVCPQGWLQHIQCRELC